MKTEEEIREMLERLKAGYSEDYSPIKFLEWVLEDQMNEVEKMYENCNIKKQYCGWLDMGDLDTQYTYVRCDSLEEFNDTAMMSRTSYSSEEEDWNKPKMEYPPFTAEKQLELIKWLINEVDYITMWHFNNSKKPYDFDLGSYNSGGETFEDALADLVNELWQDLTEEERKRIKEILE